MHAQVGPMIAEMLARPCALAVTLLEPLLGQNRVYVEKETDGGKRVAVELEIPAVVAVQIGANKPRYPSLSNILRAKNQEPESIDAGSPEESELREAVVQLLSPRKTRSGSILRGTEEEKALELLNILRERALL